MLVANYVLVVDMPVTGGGGRKRDGLPDLTVCEKLLIDFCAFLPGACPRVEMAKLYAEDGGLQSVEPAVRADNFRMVFGFATVSPQETQPFCHFRVARCDHAAVSRAAEILRGKEAEAAEIPNVARFLAVISSADALSRILDNGQLVFRGKFQDRGEIRSKSKQVHRNNCPRLVRDGFFDELDIDVECVWTYINKNGSCPRACY